MDIKNFNQPVAIFVGLGFPFDVETVPQALNVLNEWTGARGPTHAMAINVCRAAMTDETDVDASRVAFEAFARSRGILAPEALDASVSRAAEEWMAA